jgi:hypothetical protein
MEGAWERYYTYNERGGGGGEKFRKSETYVKLNNI